MTVTGTMTNTKDTPDNNFATINPLDNYYAYVIEFLRLHCLLLSQYVKYLM